MDLTNGVPIFTVDGSKTAPVGCFLVIILGIISFTMLIISFVVPDKVGAWWIWSLVFCGFIVYAIYQNKRDKAMIELYKGKNGEMLLRVKGPATDVTINFRPEAVDYWYAFEQMSMKHGGAVLVKYFCVIKGTDGKEISFKQMIGGKGTEPTNWPYRDESIWEGEGVYHLHGMQNFIREIVNYKG